MPALKAGCFLGISTKFINGIRNVFCRQAVCQPCFIVLRTMTRCGMNKAGPRFIRDMITTQQRHIELITTFQSLQGMRAFNIFQMGRWHITKACPALNQSRLTHAFGQRIANDEFVTGF